MVTVAIGAGIADELGLAPLYAGQAEPRLQFGALEPLVQLMQDTPVQKLLPILAEKLRSGTDLKQLVAAGALANARTFGGEDYVGFHTMMALAPGYHMSRGLPAEQQALPVFKVLYRNTNRIQEFGGRTREVLRPVTPIEETAPSGMDSASWMRDAVRKHDLERAERIFAATATSAEDALNLVLHEMHDDTEVHRVVLPYRAWDLIGLIGQEQANTLLRQSIRYCARAEKWAGPRTCRDILPKVLEEHRLLDRKPGDRAADDAWVEAMAMTLFKSSPEQAASAAAAALAEGFAPDAIGEAVSLAANQLILRDQGRPPSQEVSGKPIGSVHGDSIGVHACDSAGAWRNLARVARPRNAFACLILGAYQVALDRTNRGGDFQNWEPLPLERHVREVKNADPDALCRDLHEAIRGNLQGRASGIVSRYGELGHDPQRIFDVMRQYAISEDGALHAEKFYQTVSEEFATTRPKLRWRHLCALARVTASEFGRPAPGVGEARELLKAS
jgi:hypothetical protein